ncbi:UDP-glucose:(glucosyl)LPS beta-1,3-glucosyltransferase [Candidatus Magnetomoraceae bacterium gMMP-1]
MSFNPLVSVIIPCYNSAEYICEAVESVLQQSYSHYEILLINDGSIDNTELVLSPYMDRINYYYKKNGGASSARNFGINKAKGEYIAFLDADDIWRKNKLTLQMEFFQNNPNVSLVYSDSSTFDSKGILHDSVKYVVETPSGYVLDDMIIHNFLNNSTVIVKKFCFETVGAWNEALLNGNDYDIWLKISAYYEFGFVDEVLVDTRYHSQGLSSMLDMQSENSIKIQESFLKQKNDELKISNSTMRKAYSYKYRLWGQRLYYRGQHSKARKKIIKSLYYDLYDLRSYEYLFKSFIPPKLINLWRSAKYSRFHLHH